MKKPKVELKNVKTFVGTEGYGLNADVWINGINCMFVIDDATGGEFDYQHNIKHKNPELVQKNIKLLEDYIETLPEEEVEMNGKPFRFKVNMDYFINKVLEEQDKAKLEKKMEKLCEHAIVFTKPNSDSYRFIDFKQPLSELSNGIIHSTVLRVQIECNKTGEKIINKNLGKFGIHV